MVLTLEKPHWFPAFVDVDVCNIRKNSLDALQKIARTFSGIKCITADKSDHLVHLVSVMTFILDFLSETLTTYISAEALLWKQKHSI